MIGNLVKNELTESSMWGFGIAYPSQAPDGIHWDVGVSSFLEHIHGQTSSIVSIIYAIQ